MSGVVLVCAGLDPSGGAGLVADVATAAACGLRAAAVATALTVQDTRGCTRVEPVDPALVGAQLDALIDDVAIAAVKVGMLGSPLVARAVAASLARVRAPIVVDPVLRATAGVALLDGDPFEALAPFAPLAALVTPNRDEAARLARIPVEDRAGQHVAARALVGAGWAAALVKGGHLDDAESVDVLADAAGAAEFAAPRHPGPTPHGTGCALSTEIACALAVGEPLRRAIAVARERVSARIAAAVAVGRGRPVL